MPPIHGDAPALAQDLGSDINDVFAFRDPTDNPKVVLIASVHGLLVPGEVLNFAVFVLNTGTNAPASFPNGRRLQDDTGDAILTLVNNGGALSDNVNTRSGSAATNLPLSFPFLGKPNQPLFNPAIPAEDQTRN